MAGDAEESADDPVLHERFRFLRERLYAVSRAFVDRVLDGIEDQLAKPETSFATPFLIEVLNLTSSILGGGAPSEEDPEKTKKGS